MAVAIVQSSTLGLTQAAQTLSVTITGVTAGNALIVTFTQYSSTANDVPIVKDGTTVLSKEYQYTPGGNYSSVGVAWSLNVAAGSHSITLTTTSGNSGAYADLEVTEVSGLGSTQPRVFAVNTITSGTTLSLSAGTANSGDVSFTVVGSDGNTATGTGSSTVPSGYTSLWSEWDANSYQAGAAAYEVLTSTGSLALTWTGLNGAGTNSIAGVAVVFAAAGTSTNNATVAGFASPKTLATVKQSQGATTRAYASPETAVQVTQSQNATLLSHANPGTAIAGSFVIVATVAASANPQARITAAQTLAAAIDASANPSAAIRTVQTQVAQVLASMQPGVAVTATQVNIVTAQVLAFASPGVLASAFNDYNGAAALFAAIQAAVSQYYTNAKPTPLNFQTFVASGSWTVPSNSTAVYVSATAAGGAPFGSAGQQVLKQQLKASPGDVVSVTIGQTVTVSVNGAPQVLLNPGGAYGKFQAQSWGQNSYIQGFGNGADTGSGDPALAVILWS